MPDTTDDPEVTPSPTPAPDTTDDPEVTPSPSPAPDDADDPETTPSPSPDPDSTDEPEATPTPTPLPELTLVIEGATEDEEHLWHLTLNTGDPLKLKWTFNLSATEYEVSLSGSESQKLQQNTAAASISLDTSSLSSGLFTVQVKAKSEGSVLASVSQSLQLTLKTPTPTPTRKPTSKPTATPTPQPDVTDEPDTTPTPTPTPEAPDVTPTPDTTEEPESTDTPRPTIPGGKWPWPGGRGSKGRGSGSGSTAFVITPGKALISTHASGTGDMTVYGTVPLSLDADTMQILSMGGMALEVSRGGETDFQAQLAEDRLVLSSEEEGSWFFTQYALQTLARSGISSLSFSTDAGDIVISTDMSLSGTAYGHERANGFVASDFVFVLNEYGLYLNVEDRYYTVRDGVLTPIAG